jgi:SGNH hydrolase-like domain, acetyltransferase AlgX
VREIVRNLGLTLASIAFALFLVELPALFHFIDYRRVLGPQPRYGATISDPELLFIKRPHVHYHGVTRGGNIADFAVVEPSAITEYRWDVTYDRNGFRNPPEMDRAEWEVIGDSFVEAPPIAQSDLVSSVLARLQNRVVANLGQIGYGPQQELAVLRRYGIPLHPRLVIWMFYEGNDLTDALHYRDVIAGGQKGPSSSSATFLNLVARSFTNNALLQLRRYVDPKINGRLLEGVLDLNGQRLSTYFFEPGHSLTPGELHAVDMTAATIKAADQLCAAHGCRVLVAFIPDKFRVLHRFCQYPPGSQGGNWPVNDLPVRLREAVQSSSPDTEFLDLTPNLEDAVSEGIMPYFLDDSHWNAQGHKIAAQAIDRYLRTEPATLAAN